MDDIIREIQIMKHTHHLAIVTLFGAYVTGNNIWVILELMDYGAVCEILTKGSVKLLEERHVAYMAQEIVRGAGLSLNL